MKCLVCLKQVPTREWQPRIDPSTRSLRAEDASVELNEPDAYALEAALRLKDTHGGDVAVCTAGPPRASQVLREALARGADRAIHVEHERFATIAGCDSAGIAAAIADAVRDDTFDLVLTGLQSDDSGSGQTGVILAEYLGLAHATIVMDIQVAGPEVRVKRELEGGWFQWVKMALPAVLTVQSGINQLRYATLKGIMAARKKPIRTHVPVSFPAPLVDVTAFEPPRKSRQTEFLQGTPADIARTLVDRLRADARVLE